MSAASPSATERVTERMQILLAARAVALRTNVPAPHQPWSGMRAKVGSLDGSTSPIRSLSGTWPGAGGASAIPSDKQVKIGSAEDAAFIMKNAASQTLQERAELAIEIMGHQGLGWEGDGFKPGEIMSTRAMLRAKGNSIEGGTSEVNLNVVAKRVLGLRDHQ